MTNSYPSERPANRGADYREFIRRALVFAFLAAALIAPALWDWTTAGILFAVAIAVYVLIPRTSRPPGALTYDPVPAVIGPDFVGFLLTSVLFALPFWARMGEEYLWEDFGILVHPAALLSWPIAALSMSILVIAAQYASFWLLIEENGLRIRDSSRERFVPFSAISKVTPYRKGLPAWVRRLVPVLVLAGRPTAAGSILLARDATGMSLNLTDGTKVDIALEAFEGPLKKVVKALRTNGVRFVEEPA